jgi:PAS domain S-box-containing protein
VENFFTPDSWRQLAAAVDKARSEGIPYECEAELQCRQSGRGWILARGEAMRDEQGRIVALYGTVQDITPRKQAELALLEAQHAAMEAQLQARIAALNLMEDALAARADIEAVNDALRKSEERLRLAQSTANIGIWDWDIASGKLDWTGELEAMFGYATGAFPGTYQAFAEHVPVADLLEIERLREDAVAAHRSFDFDFRVQAETGVVRWINCKGGANYDQSGRPQRLYGVCIDITERKNTETQLKLWADSFENAAFGLAIVDAKTNRFLAVNPVFASERGYRTEEMIGQSVLMVYPADLVDEIKSRIKAMDVTLRGVFETEHVCKDGRRFPVMVDVTVIKSADGEPSSRIAYALDISARKAAEQALRQQTEVLQRFNRAMVGREMDMIALKQQVNQLSSQLGQQPPYPLAFLTQDDMREAGNTKS